MNIRALDTRESTSGETHPQVATIINSLIEIYHAEGKYCREPFHYERALKIHEQLLGPDHPFMAYSLSNKAENCFLQGDYACKLSFIIRKHAAVRLQQPRLEHPHTATTYYHLAKTACALERYEEAESFYGKVLSVRERTFGQRPS